mgnify:CR=1 FL=1
MTTIIALARHGVTAANQRDIFAGRTGEVVLPEGEVQMTAVARELGMYGDFAAVYCGPLARTRQSARIVAGMLDVPVVVADPLNEIRIPHWDGLTKQEIRHRFGREYPSWLEDPAGFMVAGCETIADVQQRAVAWVEGLFARHAGERALVVSHLIVVRCLLLHYMRKPLGEFRGIKVGNAQVVLLKREGGGEVVVESLGQGGTGSLA